MKIKYIKGLQQISFLILIIIPYVVKEYGDLSFDHYVVVLTFLFVLYMGFSGLYLLKIESYKPANEKKFFPYKSMFIGVSQVFPSIFLTAYGIYMIS